MRCPTLAELPPPPEGKTGWPWTVESPQLSDAMPDGKRWPRISIVTPSYNQGQFIEETIRSILLQGYPNLEYIIMDGGSTDGAVDVIQKYSSWLASWVSRADAGQAAAINTGFESASGELYNWINSDDHLAPQALFVIANVFSCAPDIDLYIGANMSSWARFNEPACNGPKVQHVFSPRDWPSLQFGIAGIPQDASFFSKRVWDKVGGLNPSLNFVFDTQFFGEAIYAAKKVAFNDQLISIMRRHPEQKTAVYQTINKDKREVVHSEQRRALGYVFTRRLLSTRLAPLVSISIRTLLPRSSRKLHWVTVDNNLSVCALRAL